MGKIVKINLYFEMFTISLSEYIKKVQLPSKYSYIVSFLHCDDKIVIVIVIKLFQNSCSTTIQRFGDSSISFNDNETLLNPHCNEFNYG